MVFLLSMLFYSTRFLSVSSGSKFLYLMVFLPFHLETDDLRLLLELGESLSWAAKDLHHYVIHEVLLLLHLCLKFIQEMVCKIAKVGHCTGQAGNFHLIANKIDEGNSCVVDWSLP